MKKFVFHLVGLPHTRIHKMHEACAFSAKIYKFCIMMKSLGHTVFLYAPDGSEVDCDEFIPILTYAEQESLVGPFDLNKLYDCDWSGKAPYWALTNQRAIEAINKRKQRGDFLCIVAGAINDPVVKGTADGIIAVEPWIGYNGPYLPFKVFESYSHMHRIWGQQNPYTDFDGKFYEAVIPNYFDPATLPYQPIKDDYFLYLGRLVKRKGIVIAVETCKQLGARLIVAGQGCVKKEGKKITCQDGEVYENVEHVGCVIGQKKADLIGRAKAMFVPTTYVEPFGGTAVEAQMCGTPVITTDWGAFAETVEHGRTGYRCRTLDHFVWAAKNIGHLDTRYIHHRAVANYSMDRVRWQFQEYFEMLSDLMKKGWYELHEDRTQLDWLKFYP